MQLRLHCSHNSCGFQIQFRSHCFHSRSSKYVPINHCNTHTCTHSHMHTFTHAHTHKHMHTLTHAHTHKHMHTLTHAHTHKHMHTLTHAHTHTRTHSQTHAHTHTCTHSHMHTLTHAHTHTCTHSHMHTLTHAHTHTCAYKYLQGFLKALPKNATTSSTVPIVTETVHIHTSPGRPVTQSYLLSGFLIECSQDSGGGGETEEMVGRLSEHRGAIVTALFDISLAGDLPEGVDSYISHSHIMAANFTMQIGEIILLRG